MTTSPQFLPRTEWLKPDWPVPGAKVAINPGRSSGVRFSVITRVLNQWINPNTPQDEQFSVMIHEYSHLLQVRVYGTLDKARSALDGSDNLESSADCMALDQGENWTFYGCDDSLQAVSGAILRGNTS